MQRYAEFSPCGRYRWLLGRFERPLFGLHRTVVFALNNPSTADAESDDNTSRKGWSYARYWDCHHLIFVNTNPFRSTDPDGAELPPESVLQQNDSWLLHAALQADIVVCAWGVAARPALAARAAALLGAVAPLHYLELANNGTPKHPLYLKGDLKPQVWHR